MASEVNASENSGTGGSSIEEDGKTDVHILAKVQSLFGEAIYEALQSKKANKRTFVSSAFEDLLEITVYLIFLFHFAEEEINDSQLIGDLAAREADAPIFTKLGFTYGKAVRFKREFQIARVRPFSPAAPAYYKPTMADMSSMSPEMRQLYLSK